MLDLSAAFDTIDHNRLLVKLENNFNITGKVLKWLQSYLVNRTFSVLVNNDHSREISLLYGVPQESILGPLLFILYVNELNNLGEEFGLTIHSYADNTTLYIGFDPVFEFDTACQNIKCCLNKVREWMNVNFLKLNMDKSQLLMSGKKRIMNLYQSQMADLKLLYKLALM